MFILFNKCHSTEIYCIQFAKITQLAEHYNIINSKKRFIAMENTKITVLTITTHFNRNFSNKFLFGIHCAVSSSSTSYNVQYIIHFSQLIFSKTLQYYKNLLSI